MTKIWLILMNNYNKVISVILLNIIKDVKIGLNEIFVFFWILLEKKYRCW